MIKPCVIIIFRFSRFNLVSDQKYVRTLFFTRIAAVLSDYIALPCIQYCIKKHCQITLNVNVSIEHQNLRVFGGYERKKTNANLQ